MAISTIDKARVAQLLLQDVEATVGPGHDAVVRHYASHVAQFVGDDLEWYQDRVAGEVQQHFHAEFIDTAWPRCPRHSNHPLWLHGAFWTCERDNYPIATLGALASITLKTETES